VRYTDPEGQAISPVKNGAMSHHTWDYATYLRERGYRVTPQRRTILDAVCAGHGHTTLAEILARVQHRDATINQATVYRNLDFLVDAGLVSRAELCRGETVYAIAGRSPHHHLICRVCRREMTIETGAVDQLQATLKDHYDFDLDAHHLMLVGVCAGCRNRA
jgi:Fur family transcriptional regulator, ferric uptake regulator